MTGFYGHYSKVLVSVDCIIFGFDEGELRVLIGKRQMDPGRGEWSLYGGFVRNDESVDDAANRVLAELTGLNKLFMRQVGAFGSVDRDPGERVISIAYYALINVKDYGDDLRRQHGVEWVNINNVPKMYSDHTENDAGQSIARTSGLPPSASIIHSHPIAASLRGNKWRGNGQAQLPQTHQGNGFHREDRTHRQDVIQARSISLPFQ